MLQEGVRGGAQDDGGRGHQHQELGVRGRQQQELGADAKYALAIILDTTVVKLISISTNTLIVSMSYSNINVIKTLKLVLQLLQYKQSRNSQF